jgi:preprotein translocase SecF subunit
MLFHIVEKRNIFFIISAIVIAAGIISMFTLGFNFDIDFLGGTTMHIELEKEYDGTTDYEKLNAAVMEVTGENVSSIQKTGDAGDEVIIKVKEIDSETRNKVFDKIKETYNLTSQAPLAVDNVSSAIGADLRKAAVMSSLVAVLLMLIYITFRFEFKTGLAAVICLVHDVLIILTFYSLFRIPMSINFIAAVLTILGYSINATIIVFDRVRENMKLQRKQGFANVVNLSIWQTMRRSINTSITTFFVISALYILGVPAIKDFALPIMMGIVAGTYSSVFISGNIWVLLKENLVKK